MGLRGFWRQHFNYGRGALYFHRVRRMRGQQALTPEPLSFYADLVRYPFERVEDPAEAARIAALLVVSQAANTAGFFYEAAVYRATRARPPAL